MLWLDDYRNPNKNDWLNFSPIGKDVTVMWAKSFDDFILIINELEFPDAICFDHDLGERNYEDIMIYSGCSKKEALEEAKIEKTGYDCAKYLIDACTFLKRPLPKWKVHSANPVGKENIEKLLQNFEKLQSFKTIK